mmetsp:Transcript_12480/g.18651  ORF Transcript_12480/g.18651 Transcript_12480/m.18651 type:complete len:120 (-) Transcript_12480:25-384(-)
MHKQLQHRDGYIIHHFYGIINRRIRLICPYHKNDQSIEVIVFMMIFSEIKNSVWVVTMWINKMKKNRRNKRFYHVKCACQDSFDVKEVTVKDALDVVDKELGGMQAWLDGKCRTRVIEV